MKGLSKRKLFEMILITNVLQFIAFNKRKFFFNLFPYQCDRVRFYNRSSKDYVLKGYLDDLPLTYQKCQVTYNYRPINLFICVGGEFKKNIKKIKSKFKVGKCILYSVYCMCIRCLNFGNLDWIT